MYLILRDLCLCRLNYLSSPYFVCNITLKEMKVRLLAVDLTLQKSPCILDQVKIQQIRQLINNLNPIGFKLLLCKHRIVDFSIILHKRIVSLIEQKQIFLEDIKITLCYYFAAQSILISFYEVQQAYFSFSVVISYYYLYYKGNQRFNVTLLFYEILLVPLGNVFLCKLNTLSSTLLIKVSTIYKAT